MQKVKRIDWLILLPYMSLSVIGLLEVYSASSYRLLVQGESPQTLFYRQLLFILISWSVVGCLFALKTKHLLHVGIVKFFLGISIVSLVLLRIGIFGVTINGAQRWLSIMGFQFQPSELANIAVILYLSFYFRKWQGQLPGLKVPIIVSLAVMLLILFQPKVSGAIIILIIAGVLLGAAAFPWKVGVGIAVIFLCLLGLAAGTVLFLGHHQLLPGLFHHVYERIAIAGNPFQAEKGAGYQMSNSYYAMYNGGFFGRGLGNSIAKRGYLPEAETDFIFSIVVEELGLIAAVVILLLLFGLCLRIFQLSSRCQNHQAGLLLLGIGTLILVQMSVNLGSVLGFIPMTGVPLPFLSYGGTSYLILSFAIGIVLNLSADQRRVRDEQITQFK